MNGEGASDFEELKNNILVAMNVLTSKELEAAPFSSQDTSSYGTTIDKAKQEAISFSSLGCTKITATVSSNNLRVHSNSQTKIASVRS